MIIDSILRVDVAATVETLIRGRYDYEFAKQMIGRACGWESEQPDEYQYTLAIQAFCERMGL